MNQGLIRILTAIVGIPVILFSVWSGGWWFFGLISLIGVVGALEWTRLVKHIGWRASPVWVVLLSGPILLRFHFEWAIDALIAGVLLFMASLLVTGVDRRPIGRFSATACALIYPVALISLFLPIRESATGAFGAQGGFEFTMLLFVLIWSADTFAYYAGKVLGRLKLAPVISPAKTWEGAAGGLAGALLVVWAYVRFRNPELPMIDGIALAGIAGVWGPVGDLAESLFKRSAGVKDSSAVLPGHGGILDRFDSLIFVAPAYYLYLTYFTTIL